MLKHTHFDCKFLRATCWKGNLKSEKTCTISVHNINKNILGGRALFSRNYQEKYMGSVMGTILQEIERTTISQMKSKTTKAVANRGVDTDAPRGENEDQKKKEARKTSRCIKYVKKWNAIYNT